MYWCGRIEAGHFVWGLLSYHTSSVRLQFGHASTSAADRYIRHVLYQDTLQQQSSPKFSYHTHVTDISIGRTRTWV